MKAERFVFFVEEPSMEAFLRSFLPTIMADGSFDILTFQGKDDLLAKLPARLRAYADWLPEGWRIVVVVDRDDDDCKALKHRLETIAQEARLASRTQTGSRRWQIANRIAVEELEAWYFGDWAAVCQAYPRVSKAIPERKGLRDPDGIGGGTSQAFERIMQKHGYFRTGLLKIEAAREIGRYVDPSRTRSQSFRSFHQALQEALSE